MNPLKGCQTNSALKIFELSKKDSDQHFLSYGQQRGCRFYNHSKNSMIYAENYQFTNAVCLREAEDVDYCRTIINVVHRNGAVKTAAIVGSLGFLWSTLIAPLWSLLSKPLKLKQVKDAVQLTQPMMETSPVSCIKLLKGETLMFNNGVTNCNGDTSVTNCNDDTSVTNHNCDVANNADFRISRANDG